MWREEWEVLYGQLNTYAWLYTYCNTLNQTPVAKIQNSSSVFYEMVEIFQMMHLNSLLEDNIQTFHLANTTGIFEGVQYLRKTIRGGTVDDKSCLHFMFDSLESDKLCSRYPTLYLECPVHPILAPPPGFLHKEDDVEYPSEFSLETLNHCYEQYHGNIHFISGDATIMGGSEKKQIAFACMQICFSLAMQKKKGMFILKIGNTYTEFALDMISLLSCVYEKVYFIRPSVIHASDSSKYLVCKDFIGGISFLSIQRMYKDLLQIRNFDSVSRIFKARMPIYIMSKLEEINSIMGQPQLEYLQYSLSLMFHKHKNEKIHNLIKQNIQKCIEWCVKFHVPYQI